MQKNQALWEVLGLEFWQVEVEDRWRGIRELADSINDVSHENGPAAFILVLHRSHQMNYLANRHMSLQVLRTSMQPCKCGVVFISLPSQQGKGSIGSPLDFPQPWKTLLTPQVHFSNSVLLVQMYQINSHHVNLSLPCSESFSMATKNLAPKFMKTRVMHSS